MTPEKLNQLHEIKRQFLERFPLESLHAMPLEVYTNLERSDSFCYWLESITYDLGSIWGGSAYKFYIFEYNQSRNTEKKNGKYLRDGKYTWLASLGDNRESVYDEVLSRIIRIASAANSGNFSEIDDIAFGDVVKWKIAYLYSNDRLVPIYSREMLERFASEYGMPDTKSRKISELQKFLVEKKVLRMVSHSCTVYAGAITRTWLYLALLSSTGFFPREVMPANGRGVLKKVSHVLDGKNWAI